MKLLIDIPDTAYEAYKEWHKQGVSNVEQSLIALAMPYEERPQGEWIGEGQYAEGHSEHYYRCSECGGHIIKLRVDDICKHCGADMRGGRDNE